MSDWVDLYMDKKLKKSPATFMLKPKPSFTSKRLKFYWQVKMVALSTSGLCSLIWPYLELQMSKLADFSGLWKLRSKSTAFMKKKNCKYSILVVKSWPQSKSMGAVRLS